MLAVALDACMVDELIDYLQALVRVVGIPVNLGELEGCMLVLLQLLALLTLVQFDEALPCLRVGGLEIGGGKVCALCLVQLVLLV